MANTCINIMHLSCADEAFLKKIVKQVEAEFGAYYIDDNDYSSYEIEFESKWIFPQEDMEAITKDNTDETLYIQVVSHEMASGYVSHHIYKACHWTHKL